MRTGGCHCGNVRYQVEGEPLFHAVCHCADCRASSGAPLVAWIAFPAARVTVSKGEPQTFVGKTGAHRRFCRDCGTGMLYTNQATLPGIVDIQSATLDSAMTEWPELQMQVAERLPWMADLEALDKIERYPNGDT